MNNNNTESCSLYFIFDLDETLYKYTEDFTVKNTINKELLKALSKYGTIIMFSNATHSHCVYWCEILGIAEYFNSILSCDIVKEVKPNPLSYKKVIEFAGIKSNDNVFFFDDQAINLYNPFKDYKWKTILINENLNSHKIETIQLDYITNQYSNINDAIKEVIKKL